MAVNVGVRLDVDGGPTFIRTVDKAARSVDDLGDQAGGASRQILQAASATSVFETALIGATAFKAVSGVFGAIGGTAKYAAVGVVGLAGGFAALSTAIPAAGILATLPGLGLSLAGGIGAAALATAGLGDALSALDSGDAEQIAETMSALPPRARELAEQIHALRPELDGLQDTAANGLIPGLSTGIDRAVRALPELNGLVSESSRVLGRLARDGGRFVGSLDFRDDLGVLGRSGARGLGDMGDAGLSLAAALTDVAVVAAPLTEWVTAGVASWAEWAAGAAEAGRASGEMAAFLDETRLVVGWLVTGVGALARGAYELAGSGTDLLALSDALAEADRTGRLSVQTWDDLARVVPAVSDEVTWLGDTLRALSAGDYAAVFGEYGDEVAETVGHARRLGSNVRDIAELFLPALGSAFTTLSEAGVPSIFELMADASGVVLTIMEGLGPNLDAVVLGFLGLNLALRAASVGQWALNAAMAANPIGITIATVTALGAAFVYLWQTNEGFVRWFGGVGQMIFDTWAAVVSTILNVFDSIFSMIESIPEGLAKFIPGLSEMQEAAGRGRTGIDELRTAGEQMYAQYSEALAVTIETQAAQITLAELQARADRLQATLGAGYDRAPAAAYPAGMTPPPSSPAMPAPAAGAPAAPTGTRPAADPSSGSTNRDRTVSAAGMNIVNHIYQLPGESTEALAARLADPLGWHEAAMAGRR